MKKLLTFLILLMISGGVFSQQWGMYTLYSQSGSTSTYLVDTASNTYKTWTHSNSNKTGYGGYLIEGDTLVRSYQFDGTSIDGGGISGGLQKVTWDGTVAWDFTYSSTDYVLHHDICPLPNGNVLCICYDKRSVTEVTQAGCSYDDAILSEKIIEVKPTGATTGEIVWEWYAWDHLCQDFNSSKDNYVASIVNNPQLLNINYGTEGGFPGPPPGMDLDWLHANGIDYYEELDQIVFSSHWLNEFYIIDHSTTTTEAAGHTGGNSGKGGDLLFRWGNPEAYEASGTTNFDVIHDAHWIPSDNPDNPGCLAAINNEGGAGGKAAVDIINPPINGYTYDITIGEAFEPTTYTYRFNTAYTSNGQSSSEQLPNSNMLLCIVGTGATYIHEVNSDGDILWTKTASGSVPQAHRYEKCFVRPVNSSITPSATTITEGESVDLNVTATAITETSPTFTYNWSSSPEGFESTSSNPNATPDETTTYYLVVTNEQSGCSDETFITINVDPVNAEFNTKESEINIYPNPNDGVFRIRATNDYSYRVVSTAGIEVLRGKNDKKIDMSNAQAGIYYIIIETADVIKTEKLIIIK